jgi:DNA-directed RNA polymerase specialized sigma24 family protein
MDQAPVATPAAGVWTTPLEREFSAQFPPLLNYVVRLTDDVEAAPAIACEAFRQGLQRAGDLTQPGARAEVLRQATELSRQWLRPRRWFRRRPQTGLALSGFPEPDARRALRRDTVQRALSAMSFDGRAALLLREYLKLSYDELADVLGVPSRKLVHVLDRSRAEFAEIYDYIKF